MKKYIKQVIFFVVALILTTVSIYEIKESSEEAMKYMPVTNKVIILDAGHGGIDPGLQTHFAADLRDPVGAFTLVAVRTEVFRVDPNEFAQQVVEFLLPQINLFQQFLSIHGFHPPG